MKHHHIKVYFDKNEVMHICPKDSVGAMALKHFHTKVQTYGLKMFDLHTDIPVDGAKKETGTEVVVA